MLQINLKDNNLGSEGAEALAPAISVSASLTEINLRYNQLGPEGGKAIAEGIRVSASLTSIDLSRNELGPEGGKAIAEGIRVSASLTSCNVLQNNMDVETVKLLVEAVKDRDISLCGIQPGQTSAGYAYHHLKPPDAVLLASDLSKAGVSASLTQVLAFLVACMCYL